MDLTTLDQAVARDAAVRRVRRLQPIGAAGDTVYPPTYPGADTGSHAKPAPEHIFERRRIGGEDVWCVLLNSVQAEANCCEQALLEAADERAVPIPYVAVEFTGCEGFESLPRVTSMDAPHRIYDAILRDSLLDDTAFLASDAGRRIARASPADARPVLEHAPSSLVFGCWHNMGAGTVSQGRFARVLVSEIVGIGTPVDVLGDERSGHERPRPVGRRAGGRIDPLGISRHVPVYRQGDSTEWGLAEGEVSTPKKVRPSEVNHGSILFGMDAVGVTFDRAEHRATVSLAGVRRLRFGDPGTTTAGRAVVAALALLGLAERDARGYALRSRCDLVADGPAPLERVHHDGTSEALALDLEGTRALYRAAHQRAREGGVAFASLRLTPAPKLLGLVAASQARALPSGADDGDAA